MSVPSSSNSSAAVHAMTSADGHPAVGQGLLALDTNALDAWNHENSAVKVQVCNFILNR